MEDSFFFEILCFYTFYPDQRLSKFTSVFVFLFAGKPTLEVSSFHVIGILKLPSEKELRVSTVIVMDYPIPLIQIPSS